MTSSLDSSFILNEGEPFLQEEYLNPLTDDFNKIYYGGFNNVKANNDIKEEEEDEEKSFSGIYFIKPKLNSIQDSNIIIDTSEKKIEGKKIEEKKIEEKKEKNEKISLFTEGKGIIQTLENHGVTTTKNDKKIILSQFKEKKFETKEMIKDEKGRLKQKKKRRKFKPDNIRKKIKAKFHRDLKDALNQKLKKAGSIKLFELLPQSFITDITVKSNNQVLDKTLKKLILYDCIEDKGVKKKTPDKDKYNKNLEVMKYLEENEEICKKSGLDKILNKKYEDILKVYFHSEEFEKSLIELYKKKNEKIDYIEEYVNKAVTYIEFFKNPPIKSFNKKGNNSEVIEESLEDDSSSE